MSRRLSHRYKDRQDVASKVAWEGGLHEALVYGIEAGDMPEGDAELAEAWARMVQAHAVFEEAAGKVDDLLPQGEVE